jgi:hypothetical protein
MKKITLPEALKIIQNAAGIVLDGVVTFPSLGILTGKDENEFMYVTWYSADGCEYSTKFMEGENQEIEVSGSSMFLIDHEGHESQITILVEANLD